MYPLLSFGVLAVRAAGVLLAAVGVWALAMLLSGRAQLPLG